MLRTLSRVGAAFTVPVVLALLPLTAATATAVDTQPTPKALVLVTEDAKRDQTPVEWQRDFSKAALASSDIVRVRYKVDYTAERLAITYKVRDLRRKTPKVRFMTVLFGKMKNYQRSILSINVVKGSDQATVWNEKTGKRAQCDAATARNLYGKDRLRVVVPFSCLFGETEFKISGHTETYRKSWDRGVIADTAPWTQMLDITQPESAA